MESGCGVVPRRIHAPGSSGFSHMLVQFGSRDTEIAVINAEDMDIDITEYLDDNTILITCECQDYAEQVYDFYEENWMLGHLRLNYNE